MLPTTGAIKIERRGDKNITINHQGAAGRQAARRRHNDGQHDDGNTVEY